MNLEINESTTASHAQYEVPHIPERMDIGPGVVTHNQACAIYHEGDDAQFAVYSCNKGIFKPSRKAQAEGWALVHATSFWQKWALKFFFDVDIKEAIKIRQFFLQHKSH